MAAISVGAIYTVLRDKLRFRGQRVKPQLGVKFFAISMALFQAGAMTQPLALVLYEKLLPGTQLVNRLQDLNYRVQTLADAKLLVECAEQAKPMIVLVDLDSSRDQVNAAISRLKQNPATKHLPVIGFSAENAAPSPGGEGRGEGELPQTTLVVSEAAILNHLPQILEQALQLE